MRTKPTTLIECFSEARRLSLLQGFKVFTPSRKYFRDEHQFIAASNDTKAKGIFRIWIYRKSLYIEFYPFFDNREHKEFLEKELGITIKLWRHHRAMRRFDTTHKMVIASEHAEFDMLIPNIRLP